MGIEGTDKPDDIKVIPWRAKRTPEMVRKLNENAVVADVRAAAAEEAAQQEFDTESRERSDACHKQARVLVQMYEQHPACAPEKIENLAIPEKPERMEAVLAASIADQAAFNVALLYKIAKKYLETDAAMAS